MAVQRPDSGRGDVGLQSGTVRDPEQSAGHRPPGVTGRAGDGVQANGQADAPARVTRRSVLVACVLLALLAPVAFFVEVVNLFSPDLVLVSGAPSAAPVALVFLLTLAAASRWLRSVGLSRRELITIYCIVMVGAPLGHRAILFYMIPKTALYYHLARANPRWETTFLSYIPSWWCPTDPTAIEGLMLGHARVPWLEWLGPLAAWSLFLLSLWACAGCLLALIQSQWITNERLSFPVAQVPLEMVQERASRPGLPTARLFWIGLAVALVLRFAEYLSYRVPALPTIPLSNVHFVSPQASTGPLSAIQYIDMNLWPWLVALLYLIPTDISFSTWFFWAARIAVIVAAAAAGLTTAGSASQSWLPASYQAAGAAAALLLWFAWLARRHIVQILRFTFTRERNARVQSESALYRWALLGLALSTCYMVVFCSLSGCRLPFALTLIGVIVGYYVLWARVRAEVGMAFICLPVDISDLMAVPGGYASFRPSEIVTAVTMRWTTFTWSATEATPAIAAGSVLESFKIADAARINKVSLGGGMVAGFLVSLSVGCIVVLTGLYRYGFFGTRAGTLFLWPTPPMVRDGGQIVSYLTNPPPAAGGNVAAAMGLGAAAIIVLGLLRLRFWWWPLHPVGYLIGNTWGSQMYLITFFFAWLCKVLVIRYGGLGLYRRTLPLAVGLIVGDLLNQMLWGVITTVTAGRV